MEIIPGSDFGSQTDCWYVFLNKTEVNTMEVTLSVCNAYLLCYLLRVYDIPTSTFGENIQYT
jgi:hypothetical protein